MLHRWYASFLQDALVARLQAAEQRASQFAAYAQHKPHCWRHLERPPYNARRARCSCGLDALQAAQVEA
jgi:hypothetical protein